MRYQVCKYNDCGWCYHDGSNTGKCIGSDRCNDFRVDAQREKLPLSESIDIIRDGDDGLHYEEENEDE